MTQLAPRGALFVMPGEAYQIRVTDTPPPVGKNAPEEA